MGFEETNVIINNRIHEIASKFSTKTITEVEKNELASLIYPKLKFHIWKFCNNQDDTEEALQWTLKKIFKNIYSFDFNKGRFTTWIYTIARNETLFYLHKKKKNKEICVGFECECGEYSQDVEHNIENNMENLYNETISEIYNIEDSLLKNIAIDKMINNEKIRCIATRYDINENTVKTKLRKIRSDIKTKVLEKNPSFRETLNHVFDL